MVPGDLKILLFLLLRIEFRFYFCLKTQLVFRPPPSIVFWTIDENYFPLKHAWGCNRFRELNLAPKKMDF